MVKFLDLRASYDELKSEIDAAVSRVLESGYYILGPEVEEFEDTFAALIDSSFAIGVGNGLDALIIALRALNIASGDEVLVPSHTFIATWLAVSIVGATPVPVDIDPETFNLDPGRLAGLVGPKTRAIIPVHLYGQPSRISEIVTFARDHGIYTIEDAAQAHGASYEGKKIGAHGDLVCWSFYPGKNLGALGDGGAITTNSASLADRVRLLRNYGSKEKYVHEEIGLNSRLDPIQATVLNIKARRLGEWNASRARIAATYCKEISNAHITLPKVLPACDPVWHLFVVKTNHRTALQAHLADLGIPTLMHYPTPPFAQKAYRNESFNVAETRVATDLASRILSLPIGPHMPQGDVERVIDAVNSFRP
jgi:dTDP-4-amino-4,6-dideoxygalactose transaminase